MFGPYRDGISLRFQTGWIESKWCRKIQSYINFFNVVAQRPSRFTNQEESENKKPRIALSRAKQKATVLAGIGQEIIQTGPSAPKVVPLRYNQEGVM